jgi:hypothetical protein
MKMENCKLEKLENGKTENEVEVYEMFSLLNYFSIQPFN